MQTDTVDDYHYALSGLDNVWLLGCVPDANAPSERRFKDLRGLHGVIAEAVITAPGPLAPKEIKFLRTELGLTCPELADLIGTDARTAYLAENNPGRVLGVETDIELRRKVFAHLDLDIPPCNDLYKGYCSSRPGTHLIRIEDDPLVGWRRAA